jgi:hypothetical protein
MAASLATRSRFAQEIARLGFISWRYRDLFMLLRGGELDADASTYLVEGRVRSADEILCDLIVPLFFHVGLTHNPLPPVQQSMPDLSSKGARYINVPAADTR